MSSRILRIMLAVALVWGGGVAAQQRVPTETIRPPPAPNAPAPPAAPAGRPQQPARTAEAQRAAAHAVRPDPAAQAPDVITDLDRLPAPVARMRGRILEAARSGELGRVLAVMQANETQPLFTFGSDPNPVTYWKTSYPDSDGVEILALMIGILEAGFVHVDKGTPQEAFIWPYFARMPLKDLTLAQKVELFKIVTGSDFKEMQELGAYTFYRLAIAPDGAWLYFVAGD
jgi:hypothetical protein